MTANPPGEEGSRLVGDGPAAHVAADRTIRRIAGTFATKLLAISLSVPVSVILARALGPEGRGEFVAAGAIAALGMQFGNLGLHSANTYFVSRDRTLLGALASNSAIVATVLGALIALVIFFAKESGFLFGDLSTAYFLLILIWIPIGIGQLLQHNLVVGIQRFAVFNNVDLSMRIATLLCCLALWLLGVASPIPYIVVAIAVTASSYLFCFLFIRTQPDGSSGPAMSLLQQQLPYGGKVFLAALFAFLVVRSDVILLKELSGSHETGVYSAAVSLVDLLHLFPVAVGVVLFPQLSVPGAAEDRWRVTRSALLHTAWLLSIGAAVLMFWGEFIIKLLFGAPFLPAYPVLVVLAPAMLFFGLNNIISVYISAIGLPWFGVWVWCVAFCANLAFNLLWIPRFGGVGAAWASLLSYALVFALQLTYVTRRAAAEPTHALAGAQL
jgi:O-antigen/teichoic acid export membrane protein